MDRGHALGFLAFTVGLLTHAIGANAFIIIGIMEPFWFFTGIIVMLPQLPREAGESSGGSPSVRRGTTANERPLSF